MGPHLLAIARQGLPYGATLPASTASSAASASISRPLQVEGTYSNCLRKPTFWWRTPASRSWTAWGCPTSCSTSASPTWSMRASAASGSPHRTQPVRGVAGLRHDRAGHGRRHEGHGDRCRPSRQGRLGMGDLFPAALAAFGLLAAVRQAEASSEGQLLDVVMYDAVLSLSERIVYQHSMTGTDPVPTGEHAPAALPVRSRGDRGRLRRGGRAVGPPLAAAHLTVICAALRTAAMSC